MTLVAYLNCKIYRTFSKYQIIVPTAKTSTFISLFNEKISLFHFGIDISVSFTLACRCCHLYLIQPMQIINICHVCSIRTRMPERVNRTNESSCDIQKQEIFHKQSAVSVLINYFLHTSQKFIVMCCFQFQQHYLNEYFNSKFSQSRTFSQTKLHVHKFSAP